MTESATKPDRFESQVLQDTESRYAFDPTIATLGDEVFQAWLELDGDGAKLVTTSGTVRATPRVRGRPLAVSDSKTVHLFWSEEIARGEWSIYWTEITADGTVCDVTELTSGDRRPLGLTGCRTPDGIFVVWESVHGTDAEIQGKRLSDGDWLETEALSATGIAAAHDAAVSADDDGMIYLLYTALRDGWYEIEGRTYSSDG